MAVEDEIRQASEQFYAALQRVALLLTHPYRRCTILAQKSSWTSVDAHTVEMVQLHCKPL